MKPTDPKNSMIGGHAQYVKGMVNEKIGAAMGSEEWIQSGKADMNEGKVAMKVCIYCQGDGSCERSTLGAVEDVDSGEEDALLIR